MCDAMLEFLSSDITSGSGDMFICMVRLNKVVVEFVMKLFLNFINLDF